MLLRTIHDCSPTSFSSALGDPMTCTRGGWLVVVEATHGSSHSPRTQPPPADLRVSSEDVIADPPRQFLVVRLPKKKETGPKRTEPDDRIPEANCTHSKSTF